MKKNLKVVLVNGKEMVRKRTGNYHQHRNGYIAMASILMIILENSIAKSKHTANQKTQLDKKNPKP